MSNKRPLVPEVSLETWRELLQAALDYRQLAPWQWMEDAHVLGLVDPATQKVRLASVFGAAQEVYGLFVFRGELGLRFLLGLMWGSLDGLDPVTSRTQDALTVDFGPKSQLDKDDLALFRQLQFAPSKGMKQAWPMFRSYVPGLFPWHLNQAEAELLASDLRRVSAFARLFKEHPDLYEARQKNEFPFYPAEPQFKGPLRLEDLQWHKLELLPLAPPPPVQLEPALQERLRALPRAEEAVLELDSVYGHFAVSDGERPYFPRMAMIVERGTGYILGQNMGHSGMTLEESAGKCLVELMQNLRLRPARVYVSRQFLEQALAPLCEKLGIDLATVPELPALEEAQAELQQMMGPEAPGSAVPSVPVPVGRVPIPGAFLADQFCPKPPRNSFRPTPKDAISLLQSRLLEQDNIQ